MNKFYVYKDNSNPDKPTVFKCEAADILEADKLYEQQIGIDPTKQNYIGCSSWMKPCDTLVHCDFCEEQNCDARIIE